MSFILGIDTSCDDTSFAVLDQTGRVLANLVSSQTKLHAPYGGIVPELASRAHMENLTALFDEALKIANIKSNQLTSIAVTQTPGLISCLLVGTSFAKALAYRLQIPFYAVNHLEGHLFSPFIESQPVFPFLGLVVSGGHTAFYEVNSFDEIKIIGQTVDDAAGEAFDKVAKMLGLGYPGGPIVDKLAQTGNNRAFEFKISKVKMGQQYMSFSGLKTAAHQILLKQKIGEEKLADFCASLQSSIVAALTEKLEYFLNQNIYPAFALSGGVAMNSLLRTRCQEVCRQNEISCFIAKPEFCQDNAAMIAYAGMNQKREGDLFLLNALASKKIQAREIKNMPPNP